MNQPRRCVIVVLDGVGVGALPDADRYGDAGADSLGNTARAVGGLRLPNLFRLGLGCIADICGIARADKPLASWGKMAERSPGKDTTTGHWELAGVVLEQPFPTYPDGFPREVIQAFEAAIGRSVLGNRPASGTQIIAELGPQHIATGRPIVYTSADSVFQIAAHEEVVPPHQLYEWCEMARRILVGEHAVARVIARPFVGRPGHFKRTERRRDFSLPPPRDTVLDAAVRAGLEVRGVGKIDDIFAARGISRCTHTANNTEGLRLILANLREPFAGVLFTNLVDTDTLYGHRNDASGYARAVEEIDGALPSVLEALTGQDLLIVTADHGCDPTHPTTDHTREYVPLLVYAQQLAPIALGVRDTFADVAATCAAWLGLEYECPGAPFALCHLDRA